MKENDAAHAGFNFSVHSLPSIRASPTIIAGNQRFEEPWVPHLIFNYICFSISSVTEAFPSATTACPASPRFLSELSDEKVASEDGFGFSLTYTSDENPQLLGTS